MIPKTVYQTWRYMQLPGKVEELRAYMRKINPDYTFLLYDDAAIEAFIADFSLDKDDNDLLLTVYKKLTLGAAKADFWRYLVLYKYGGIYLDMDAIIVPPIDILYGTAGVGADTTALITRETNEGIFNNWVIAFAPAHPFLEYLINYCCWGILGVDKVDATNILELTGPLALTRAFTGFMDKQQSRKPEWDWTEFAMPSPNSNNWYNMTDAEFADQMAWCNMRIYKQDMGGAARCKHRYAHLLYGPRTPHWRQSP